MNKRAYDLFWGITLRSTTAGHRLLHKVSGGRLGRRFIGGGQIIWVTSLGRKSGEWRTAPLLAVPDTPAVEPAKPSRLAGSPAVEPSEPSRLAGSPDWVITGSNAGQERVPGWVFNMREHADGYCLIDDTAWTARFVEVEGPDRDALYDKLIATWKGYEMYADNAGRYIPVFRVQLLDRIARSAIPG